MQVWAAFGTTGQRCTAASRLIVQKGVAADFVDSLEERAKALRIGDGLQDGVQLGPIVNMQQLRRVHRYTTGRARGARYGAGGRRNPDRRRAGRRLVLPAHD